MATLPRSGLPGDYSNGQRYTDVEIERVHDLIETQMFGSLIAHLASGGAGVVPFPNADAWKVTAGAGLSVSVAAGAGICSHSQFDVVWMQTKAATTKSNLAASSILYLHAAVEGSVANDTRETGLPNFVVSSANTLPNALTLARITTNATGVVSIDDLRAMREIGSGGGLDASQIGDGQVSNIEYSYLNGVTSSIQQQLDDRVLDMEVADLAQDAFEAGDNVTFTPIAGNKVRISAAQDLTATLVSDAASVTTPMLAPGDETTVLVTLGKTARLNRCATSAPAWVRLYPSVAARNADSSRAMEQWYEGDDLVFDLLTQSGDLSDNLGGGVDAASTESPRLSTFPLVVRNMSATTQAITVTIQKMTLEV